MSHTNLSFHLRMSHATLYESCHTCMSHVKFPGIGAVKYATSPTQNTSHIYATSPTQNTSHKESRYTHEWVTSHMNQSFHRWLSHATYARIMSHMHESCQISRDWCSKICNIAYFTIFSFPCTFPTVHNCWHASQERVTWTCHFTHKNKPWTRHVKIHISRDWRSKMHRVAEQNETWCES